MYIKCDGRINRSRLQIPGKLLMRRSALLGLLIATLLAVAISLEVRMAMSAFVLRRPSVNAALRAARLTPANEDIYLQLSDLDPGWRGLYLHKAAELNPSDARPWLELGVMAEANNNRDQAELDLNQAAKLDVRSKTAWALADFYFRQNNIQEFYFWGSRYRKYADGNVTGLYRLDWSRNPQTAALLRDFSPLSCRELAAMANFVESHAAAADDLAQVEQQLALCADKQAVTGVMDGVTHLLMADQPETALQTWNSLHRNAAFHYAGLDPAAGRILTNADFAQQLEGSGFDWRINQTPGIHVRRVPEERSLEFTLDGSEPDASTLLFQPVILVAGTTYQLDCKVQSEEGDENGFHWRLVELSSGKTLESGQDSASRQNGSLSWTFLAPVSPRTLVLAFTYIRPKGEIRSEGKVRLSDITLRAE
jgi:tetratricopeptide (TPR) repeat protein